MYHSWCILEDIFQHVYRLWSPLLLSLSSVNTRAALPNLMYNELCLAVSSDPGVWVVSLPSLGYDPSSIIAISVSSVNSKFWIKPFNGFSCSLTTLPSIALTIRQDKTANVNILLLRLYYRLVALTSNKKGLYLAGSFIGADKLGYAFNQTRRSVYLVNLGKGRVSISYWMNRYVIFTSTSKNQQAILLFYFTGLVFRGLRSMYLLSTYVTSIVRYPFRWNAKKFQHF